APTVPPVAGLDQPHPHVVRDRQQQLAQVFRLLGLFGDEFEFLELGKTFDQRADVLPEHLVDLGAGCGSILDSIVQQRGGDRGIVELDRKSTRLNSSHGSISYAVFCWQKKKTT